MYREFPRIRPSNWFSSTLFLLIIIGINTFQYNNDNLSYIMNPLLSSCYLTNPAYKIFGALLVDWQNGFETIQHKGGFPWPVISRATSRHGAAQVTLFPQGIGVTTRRLWNHGPWEISISSRTRFFMMKFVLLVRNTCVHIGLVPRTFYTVQIVYFTSRIQVYHM